MAAEADLGRCGAPQFSTSNFMVFHGGPGGKMSGPLDRRNPRGEIPFAYVYVRAIIPSVTKVHTDYFLRASRERRILLSSPFIRLSTDNHLSLPFPSIRLRKEFRDLINKHGIFISKQRAPKYNLILNIKQSTIYKRPRETVRESLIRIF